MTDFITIITILNILKLKFKLQINAFLKYEKLQNTKKNEMMSFGTQYPF